MAFLRLLCFITLVVYGVSQTTAPTYANCDLNSIGSNSPCNVMVTYYDHAPAWNVHSRYPSTWWNIPNVFYDFPANGSAGNANNSYGWVDSDFELPLWRLQGLSGCCSNTTQIIQGERGLAGPVCKYADNVPASQVCGQITLVNGQRVPQYAYPGKSPFGQVSSPESFYSFFTANQRTVQQQGYLTLTPDYGNGPNVRKFNQPEFFPLDGQGWKDWQVSSYDKTTNTYTTHNFAYCFVMNSQFIYTGNETFFFAGDDDVYVYINDYLVIDLGGVHVTQNVTLHVNTLNLTLGKTYRFDFFYCERHSVASDIAFETSLNFQCGYQDWCGVCDGDGQSCCTPGLCDDGNNCTTDLCAVKINPYNNPVSGCNFTNITCPPSNECFLSLCSQQAGACVYQDIRSKCDDGNDCTIDSCSNSTGCSNVNITCATDSCTNTVCNKVGGCSNTTKNCNQSNMCYSYGCSTDLVGGCYQTELPCKAVNACVSAQCFPDRGCVQIPKPCTGGNMCTNNTCDAKNGCQYPPLNNCPANDTCGNYTCNPLTGTCDEVKTNCNLTNKCFTTGCDASKGGCYKFPVPCLGNECFNSQCNPDTGLCVITQPTCATAACLTTTCVNSTGCVNTTTNCKQGSDPCSPSTCSTQTGQCAATTIAGCTPLCGGIMCNYTTDPCNPQKCINNQCVTQSFDCSSSNVCANNTCKVIGGAAVCVPQGVTCPQPSGCTVFSCISSMGGCVVTTNYTCDDGNDCTTDKCISTSNSTHNCSNIGMSCPYTDACFPMACQGGQCVNTTGTQCYDGNPCTQDICVNGTCPYPPTCEDPGTLCNPISCNNGQCVTTPVNCTNENLCIVGQCNELDGQCMYNITTCPSSTTCNPLSCNPSTGNCETPEQTLDCSNGNVCTNYTILCDDSQGFYCNYTDLTPFCSDDNACTNDYCNGSAESFASACYHDNVTCTAPSLCTVVTGCSAQNGCIIVDRVCPTYDWCNPGSCDPVAECINPPRGCAPADNFCFQGSCDNVSKSCVTQQRAGFQTLTSQNGVLCPLVYSTPAKAGLAAGVVAAIVIAAVVAAALIAVAGKKGVDIYMASRAGPIGGAQNNPLYAHAPGSGNNPLYG